MDDALGASRRQWLRWLWGGGLAGGLVAGPWAAAAGMAGPAGVSGAVASPSAPGAPPPQPRPHPKPHPTPQPGTRLVFPADHGAHPDYRTEWWYATGGLRTAAGEVLGFQITFFRSRVDVNALVPVTPAPGRFAPRHLLLAHGALSDVAAQRQWHGQRLGRWNGDAAVRPHFAAITDTHMALGGWAMQRRDVGLTDRTSSEYLVKLDDAEFGFDLRLLTTQPLLLQGEAGWSRKGPNPAQASFYYSQPQLAVTGTVRRPGQADAQAVTGTAWLDHEWSESVMPPDAVGWDWVGMNLDNGAALTAFQLRRADGSAVWAGGSWRAAADAPTRVLTPQDLRWVPLRQWVSPSSQASYPVRWRLDTPMGVFEVHALLDAQELDSRQTTGTVYWEGLSELREAVSGQRVGRGYLEMTGYAGRLNL